MTAEEKMAICRQCPLYKEDINRGAICNSKLYLSKVDGKTTSMFPRANFVKGCSCNLDHKTKNNNGSCPAGK